MAEVRLTIWGIDKASATFRKIQKVGGGAFNKIKSAAGSLKNTLFSLKGAIAAVGIAFTAKSFTDVASSFEDMEIKLNALTKGKGKETLEEINAWALKMPVNTRKAVDTFIMMQAMGLNPTIEKMQILTDVSSIFGEDAMPRVARALGQMMNLGRLSAEELNQLAEAGINARKYLTDAFGGQTVEQIQKGGADIKDVVDAIWQGLKKDFAGAAEQAMETGRGLKTTLISYFEEIQRKIMESGPYKLLKDSAKSLVQYIDKNWDKIIKASRDVGAAIVESGTVFVEVLGKMAEATVVHGAGIIDWVNKMRAGLREGQIENKRLEMELYEKLQAAGIELTEDQKRRYAELHKSTAELVDKQREWAQDPEILPRIQKATESIKSAIDEIKASMGGVKKESSETGDVIANSIEKPVSNATQKIKLSYSQMKAQFIEMNQELAKKKGIKVDNSQALGAIDKVKDELKEINNMVLHPKVVVDTYGTGSPTKPFSEYMDYMESRIGNLPSEVDVTADFSKFSSTYIDIFKTMKSMMNPYSRSHPGFWETERMLFPMRQMIAPLFVAAQRQLQRINQSIHMTNTFHISGADSQSIARQIEEILSRRIKYGRSALA
jgi:tape measure domain-containing protein